MSPTYVIRRRTHNPVPASNRHRCITRRVAILSDSDSFWLDHVCSLAAFILLVLVIPVTPAAYCAYHRWPMREGKAKRIISIRMPSGLATGIGFCLRQDATRVENAWDHHLSRDLCDFPGCIRPVPALSGARVMESQRGLNGEGIY